MTDDSRELEYEFDGLSSVFDTIRAKTIEECVAVIKEYYGDAANTEIISDLIAAIRDLAQTPHREAKPAP
jgi:hypothetical protein